VSPLRAAIVGCGNIADAYGRTLQPHDSVAIVGATDLDRSRSAALTARWGGEVYDTLDDLLGDEAVDVVVNLTTQHAHVDVSRRCLDAGKHVYSEKPLAFTFQEASALAECAEANGVRLACAPITFMGEAQQTAWRALREGAVGQVKVVYAEANWGRIERWHPNPMPFLEAGALFDVAPYPVTYLTSIFGPVRSATGFGRTLAPQRRTLAGTPFVVESPDFVAGMLEFASGVVARLTVNFYVSKTCKQRGIEFHGDDGLLFLGCWQAFDAAVEVAGYDGTYTPVPYARTPYQGTEWGRGLVELAAAIAEGRPQRATARHAAHVTEVLCALDDSLRSGRRVEVTSDFSPPSPMDWAA
jgi:predicted dehydrogenase